jgi:hypothetical protein
LQQTHRRVSLDGVAIGNGRAGWRGRDGQPGDGSTHAGVSAQAEPAGASPIEYTAGREADAHSSLGPRQLLPVLLWSLAVEPPDDPRHRVAQPWDGRAAAIRAWYAARPSFRQYLESQGGVAWESDR